MGLFSDTCEALVDNVTGRALTGERLLEIENQISYLDRSGNKHRLAGKDLAEKLNTLGVHVCGNNVKKRARFCNKCGMGAPGGWVKCPVCKKWVGNDSHYCPHCNCQMHPDTRVDFANGVWSRPNGVFAQRIEIGDIRRIMKDGLQVQEGTIAVLLDGGKAVKVLQPGRYNPESNLRAINWFGNAPQRTAILFDSGDSVYSVRFDNLISGTNDLPINMSAEITLRLIENKAIDFVENYMKGDNSATYDGIGKWLENEILYIAKNFAATSSIEDLVKDPERRPHFEHEIESHLSKVFERLGLEFIRVGAVEFYGPNYDTYSKQMQEFEQSRREIEYNQKLRDLLNSSKMSEAKDNNELLEYMEQLAQEKDIRELNRSTEMKLVIMAKNHEVSVAEADEAMFNLQREHALKLKEQANARELDLNTKKYFREDELADANHETILAEAKERTNEIIRKGVRADVELKEWARFREAETTHKIQELNFELEKAKQELSHSDKDKDQARELEKLKALRELNDQIIESETKAYAEKAKATAGLSAAQLAALSDDPVRAQQLAQLAMLEAKKGLSAEQLLALGAENSPAAAQAAAAAISSTVSERERELMNRMLEEQKALLNAVLANSTNTANQFAEVAKTAAARVDAVPAAPSTTQIIK